MRLSNIKAAALSISVILLSAPFNLKAQQGMGVGNNNPLEMLDVSGAIKVGTTANTPPGGAGTIRWNGTNFEGWDGTQWITFGAGADGDWTVSGNDIYNSNVGNVGIGTASPVNLLHVQNNVSGLNFPVFLRNSSINSGDGVGIGFLSEPNGNWIKAGVFYERTGGFGTGKLHFLTDNAADNGTVTLAESRMTIQPDGNVGIGTTTPGANLDINSTSDAEKLLRFDTPRAWVFEQDGTGSGTQLSLRSETNGKSFNIVSQDGTSRPATFHARNASSGNSEVYLVPDGGNVGVGTEVPEDELHVEGSIRMVDGNQAANKVMTSDANGTASWVDPNTLITNDVDWTITGNDQYSEVSGNVGIGTSSPAEKLDVFNGDFQVGRTGNTQGSFIAIRGAKNGGNVSYNNPITSALGRLDFRNTDYGSSGTEYVSASIVSQNRPGTDDGDLRFYTTNDLVSAEAMNISNTGNVGIGTIASTALHVANVTGAGTTATVESGSIQYPAAISVLPSTHATSRRTALKLDDWLILQDRTGTGTKDFSLYQTTGNAHRLTINTSGNVGLTVQNPQERLHVNGSIRMVDGNQLAGRIPVSDADGKMVWTDPATIATSYVDEVRDADNDTKIQVEESANEDVIRFDLTGTERWSMVDNRLENTDNSVYIGNDAGLADNGGTAFFNTAIGVNALKANTSGGATAVGANALTNATAGGNTAIGANAFLSTTSGNLNTGLGQDVGYSNTTGAENVVVGQGALRTNSTGSNNVAIGRNAGRNGGSKSGNVYLGHGAGNGATGDNKLYIENSNSATPLIYGEFDNDLLRVNGTLNINNAYDLPITDGTSGYLMTTDGSGAVTWTDPATIATSYVDEVRDADNDTKIQVEESADEDNIRFDLAGTEHFRMEGPRLHVVNSGQSVFMGAYAGDNDDLSNNNNTAVGYGALEYNILGAGNTAVGTWALQLSTGGLNTAVGKSALAFTTGAFNTAVGGDAAQNLTTGSDNVVIGRAAFLGNNGSQNTLIGKEAGRNGSDRSGNVYLGYQAGYGATGDNKLYIENSNSASPLIYGEFDNDLLRVNGTLNINNAYDLPITDGTSGYLMTTDGSGVVTWTDPATISTADDGDWTVNGTDLYNANTGNVGIGTTTPGANLDINSTSDAEKLLRFNTPRAWVFEQEGTGSTTQLSLRSETNGKLFNIVSQDGTSNAASFHARNASSGNSEVLLVPDGGNVGIGTTTPSANLDITSTADAEKLLRFDTPRSWVFEQEGTGSGTELTLRSETDGKSFNIVGSDGTSKAATFHARNASSGNSEVWLVPDGGNVGVGLANPAARLHVNGTSQFDGTINTNNQWISGDGGAEGIHIQDDGDVGIGTNNPQSKMDIYDGSLRISHSTSSPSVTFEDLGDNSKMSIHYNRGDDRLEFRNDGGTVLTVIESSGDVAIGTPVADKAQLQIQGHDGLEDFGSYGFLSPSGATGTSNTDQNYSIWASDYVAAESFHAFSDSRIKNIKGISNSEQDLNTLMDIEVTDYQMKDQIQNGNGDFKKVIAQQVKEVYPQAVNANLTDVVPDVYTMASLKNGWVQIETDLQVGERVKLILEDGEQIVDVIEVGSAGFKVDLTEEGEVFVYGREVNDFHTVDYEALAMLNISATQELVKMINKLKQDNAAMENRLTAEIDAIKSSLGLDLHTSK